MSRSLKKVPFVNKKLLERIEALNAANEKKVLKTWSRPSTICVSPIGARVKTDNACVCPRVKRPEP